MELVNLDVNVFCQDIIDAARSWHVNASTTALYQANAAKCGLRRPRGLAPYVVGVPGIG
jgi:hypothetical protein